MRKLEEVVATRLGKAAALFVPSGTMANQLAIRCHVQPGDDDAVFGRCPHQVVRSQGRSGAGRAQLVTVGHGGFFTVAIGFDLSARAHGSSLAAQSPLLLRKHPQPWRWRNLADAADV